MKPSGERKAREARSRAARELGGAEGPSGSGSDVRLARYLAARSLASSSLSLFLFVSLACAVLLSSVLPRAAIFVPGPGSRNPRSSPQFRGRARRRCPSTTTSRFAASNVGRCRQERRAARREEEEEEEEVEAERGVGRSVGRSDGRSVGRLVAVLRRAPRQGRPMLLV